MSAEGRTAALAVRLLGSGSSEFRLHLNVESDLVEMRNRQTPLQSSSDGRLLADSKVVSTVRQERFSHTKMGRVAILKLTVLSPATRILKHAVAPAWCARSVPKLGEHRAP